MENDPFTSKFALFIVHEIERRLIEWSTSKLLNIIPMDEYYYCLLEKSFFISIYLLM